MTLVSITVCVRNGVNWIDGCMESLLAQTYSPIEIIVVDDGSSDGSRQKVESWGNKEGITAILQNPLGLSAARMAAVENSNGEWVAITDIDVRPESTWIEQMVLASPSQEGEEVVAVTGRTVFAQANDIISRIRSIEIASKYRSRPRRTTLANGPCSMFKREPLLKIGGFNPDWYHAEDMEVSLKLIKEGGTIVYTQEAVVNHVPETGLFRFLHKRRRDARAHVRIHRRYRDIEFDFLGSSWLVLSYAPVLFVAFYSLFLGASTYEGNSLITHLKELREPYFLLIPLGIWWILAFRSNLRSVVINTRFTMLVILGWSLALWQGICLGYLDALLKRRGHS
ncbi:MAG: glycosyltransferase [Candidatus Poseidoniaceae archaeon]|jgi:cellulose synthase/poly-beta-1,6-N-acetylglucosamine synthase-like glycosyltransferase|nr:glycosyltransferase [Candidatus Poseidoniaceae archaeon]